MQNDVTIAAMSHAGHSHARALAPTPAEWCDNLLALYRAKLDGSSG
jgi:hypothetical protein